MTTPLGVDTHSPRLSWKIPSAHGDSITGCRVWVAADSVAVAQGTEGCWDSGELPATARRVAYAGDSLRLWTKYYWNVGFQTKGADEMVCSPVTSFTTGVFLPVEWEGARWISDGHDKDYHRVKNFIPDSELKKKF